MVGNWVAKALGKTQPIELSDSSTTHDGLTMLLVQGQNTFGDEIFTYIRLPLRRIEEIKQQLNTGQNFVPSHYGTVIAAGRGKPTPDITEEVGIPEFMVYFEPKPSLSNPRPQKGGY